uniref:Uncharacterized protein n=1 Tax=Salix viminalis TaxID=40686 RepID=A0A6N2KEN2_SALVM
MCNRIRGNVCGSLLLSCEISAAYLCISRFALPSIGLFGSSCVPNGTSLCRSGRASFLYFSSKWCFLACLPRC